MRTQKYPSKPLGGLLEILRRWALNSQFCLKETNHQNWNLFRDQDWCRQGGPNKKNLPWEGYGYVLEQHNTDSLHQMITQILFILAVRLQFIVILLSIVSLTSLASINISGRNIVLTNALDSLCKFGIIRRS